MLIPHSYEPTPEERYQIFYRQRMKKAKHLKERVELFLQDIDRCELKSSDKTVIRKELLNIFNRNNQPTK